MRTTSKSLIHSAFIGVGLVCALSVASEALAVIGMPLTPMSYAGVARRTTRRTVAAASVASTAATTAAITELPAGCAGTAVNGVTVQQCGSNYYRPYYQGTNVVYQPYSP
jgi:hypothetical protein